ncbi:SDR family oxidoreductase [Paracoccus sp. 1_MG-2023]|uniref:SDR family NAD(P)-dependent oxidoreductase n=1 Tax=unclassified Paracoccus (in: a-proteobacteria) TaxID=2688777 RepID=UPI001C08A7EC|nr:MULTISPECIES: SDR family oxidoreductase [unclassified Paracoccus (in: a-proteobacteria)]MBU2957709.1 SDR family oxidoreductase [Paracoccus sp. C2R09]MDO6667443.1 SDR family oxidoreductase [Paracoccus sp. 1_MG-2023]
MSNEPKIAIVTGGLTGIGAAVAQRFVRDGMQVVIGARRGGDAERQREVADKLGDAAMLRHLDVRDTDSVQEFTDAVIARHGRIDAIVNAAGVYEEAPVDGHPDRIWNDTIDTNLTGTFKMVRAVMPVMLRQKYGRIVNIASVAAHQGMADNAAYCASKAGILGLSRCVSLEGAAHGVTCNSISPTWVETEMLQQFIQNDIAQTGLPEAEIRARYEASNPQGKLVQPDEIANLAAFLASDGARAITMADYQVNAGSLW